MAEQQESRGPNLAYVEQALRLAGWTTRFVPARADYTGRWNFEARKGLARMEIPRGEGGRYAPVVQRLTPSGDTEWASLFTPQAPVRALLQMAFTAAG
ncbi:hypothetical protein [Salinispora vitiensis]|uniref:hypothetical protein n=1 Tax=Salinispora vitiensis TaxID=999544 RepID=UPI0003760139|nr:hypothetical protein [Salinispora vitiensis]